MAETKLCPECKVPELITSQYLWLNSGVMVMSNNLSRRVGVIESENLDPLYYGIGEIIGTPIDHLVIDIVRRGTVDYGKNLIPPEVMGMIRNRILSLDIIVDVMISTAKLNGFGKYELVEIRLEGDRDDYSIVRVTKPFSLLLCAGTQAGSGEILSDNSFDVVYKEISSSMYELRSYVSEHTEEIEERLPIKEYQHRDGDIELERCATCGGPGALSGFKWHLDEGMIMNDWTGRRMAMIGPEIQDPLFEELEKELGETIPQAVVEAQRRFMKSGSYSIEEMSDEGISACSLP